MDLPGLDKFYFDRVWVKAYPAFFSNLRDPGNYDEYRDYRDTGVFEDMTDSAFRLYRTLRLIRDGLARGYSVDDIPKHVDELARYGERDFYEFYSDNGEVVIRVGDRRYRLKPGQVGSVRLVEYTRIVGNRAFLEKAIYMELAPWLRIMVKPYLSGFVPPLVRLFYNPLIKAKHAMGLGDFGYEHEHDNYIDPGQVDLAKFIELNHKYAFDRGLVDLVHRIWRMWFNRDDELRVKVSQVELAYDSKIPKIRLAYAFHFIGGRVKVIRSEVAPGLDWDDAGLKYYITIKKGLQVKLYTKAWSSQGALNRLEFTIGLNEDLDNLDAGSLIRHSGLVEAYLALKKALLDEGGADRIRRLIMPFIDCRSDCDRHYAFWLDLLLSGQVKGSRYYSDIAKLYRRKGLIKVVGRGRNSVYVLDSSLASLSEEVRKALGASFIELIPHAVEA